MERSREIEIDVLQQAIDYVREASAGPVQRLLEAMQNSSPVSGQRPTGQRASTPMPSNVDCSKPRLVLYEQEGFFAGRRGCQDNKGCEIVPRKSEQQQQKVSMTPDQTPGRDTYSACGIR